MMINGIIDFGKFCGFRELLYRQPIARIGIEHESFVSYFKYFGSL